MISCAHFIHTLKNAEVLYSEVIFHVQLKFFSCHTFHEINLVPLNIILRLITHEASIFLMQ